MVCGGLGIALLTP
ncbi:hypothetical protein M2G69_21720 [Vibrio vulnificus]|nr:hypothetical protein [Vibrio vulnificus]MCU8408818.1 hypothetical protein [Vibrio vulnificus]